MIATSSASAAGAEMPWPLLVTGPAGSASREEGASSGDIRARLEWGVRHRRTLGTSQCAGKPLVGLSGGGRPRRRRRRLEAVEPGGRAVAEHVAQPLHRLL